MTINALTTVRDVAIELPRATRLFEELKIDYCCGGNTPLTDACVSAGVALNDVMRMIQEAETSELNSGGAIDFQKISLTELIKHILDQFPSALEQRNAVRTICVSRWIGHSSGSGRGSAQTSSAN